MATATFPERTAERWHPGLAPPGKHAASAFSLWFPVEAGHAAYARLKAEMGQRVIEKITRLAPNFAGLISKHTTFTPQHMSTMFGAPGGDYCYGLIHPEQMGPNRPVPSAISASPSASTVSTSAAQAAMAAPASPSSPATTRPRPYSATSGRYGASSPPREA